MCLIKNVKNRAFISKIFTRMCLLFLVKHSGHNRRHFYSVHNFFSTPLMKIDARMTTYYLSYVKQFTSSSSRTNWTKKKPLAHTRHGIYSFRASWTNTQPYGFSPTLAIFVGYIINRTRKFCAQRTQDIVHRIMFQHLSHPEY